MVAPQPFEDMHAYIDPFPQQIQDILRKIKQVTAEAVPDAEETISYGMPTFTLHGQVLVYFAGWQHHVALYPVPAGDEAFQKEIAPYKREKSSIHFPLDKPIPYDLVKKIVRFRAQEVRYNESNKHTHL